ncbi:condensation domain-containing protein [Kitasatospora sp. NPDC048365]|uniref:condensation domain-containing protein n=1 Tax=Kitasatospora sp. NPDC048365 TaxID=3364050 RepID=UPI0037212EB8
MTTERVTIAYRVPGEPAEAPLTLGQDNMIRCLRRDLPSHMNKHAVWPVPPGADRTACLDALRTLAERHAALRTVFPGPAGDQPSRQRALTDGEFGVDVTELDPAEDPDARADEVTRHDREFAFVLAEDFPLRCTLLTRDGVPLRLAVVICHAQLDGTATGLLFQDWVRLASGEELPPATGRTPIEVAELEQSASGRRRATAALRHWERILREEPVTVFADDRIGPNDARLPTLVLRSVKAADALERTARRTGAGPSAVLLACYAALAAARADQTTVVVAALSANRHRPGLADHIGTLAQDALLALDTAAADLDELIGRTQASALGGYWHSTFDAEKIWQLIEDVAVDRGARFVRQVVVNDLSGTVPPEVTPERADPAVDPLLAWLPPDPIPTRLMLNIWRVTGCLELTLHTHRDVLDRAESERFAHALLDLLELAAERPVPLAELAALAGLPTAVRDKGSWHRVDNTWIDLDAVADLVRTALDPQDVDVEHADGRLTARITTRGRALTPAEAHAAVMAALPGHDRAMAPHHYVLTPYGEGPGRPEAPAG